MTREAFMSYIKLGGQHPPASDPPTPTANGSQDIDAGQRQASKLAGGSARVLLLILSASGSVCQGAAWEQRSAPRAAFCQKAGKLSNCNMRGGDTCCTGCS